LNYEYQEPKIHDIGGLLLEHEDKFPKDIAKQLRKLADISKRLRKEMELVHIFSVTESFDPDVLLLIHKIDNPVSTDPVRIFSFQLSHEFFSCIRI